MKHIKFILGLLLLATTQAQAHTFHNCLRLVEQAAESLKSCSVKEGNQQCSDLRRGLTSQINQCRSRQFTDEHIIEAIREGESKVKGTSSYFLKPKKVVASEQAEDINQGNLENYTNQFAFVKGFPVEDLTTGANAGGCHQAYLTSSERFRFSGRLQFERYLDQSDATQSYDFYFFTKVKEGICYKAPKPAQKLESGEWLVVNIPQEFFDYLRRSAQVQGAEAVVTLCESQEECGDKKERAKALHVDYQTAYTRLSRLQSCEEISRSSEPRHGPRAKRFTVEEKDLPAYCAEDTLEENISRLQGMLKRTGKALFEDFKN